MIKTEKRLCNALKAMMEDKPLEDISVTAISKKCNVNRQTFYYHFHDIYDVLSLVYLDEKIERIEDSKTIEEMLSHIFTYCQKNMKFVTATIASSAKDLFKEFIFNNIYQCIISLLDNISEITLISVVGKKNIARFYASGIANAFLYALEVRHVKTLKQLLADIEFIDDEYLLISVRKLARKELIKN